MTTALADIQARLFGHVVEDRPAPLDLVRTQTGADVETRLSIYRNGYRSRLLEVLGEDYPALKLLLGDHDFAAMGDAYIAKVRSRHYSIRWFGHAVADYLERDGHWRNRPDAAAVARWEWALGEAADAADATAVDTATIAAVPPERWSGLRLAFHPSLRRLDLAWSVPAFRLAVEAEEPSPPVPVSLPVPVAWVIWRDGTKILYRSLAANEAAALDAARAGRCFGQVCETLADACGADAAAGAAGFLAAWVDAGWIAGAET